MTQPLVAIVVTGLPASGKTSLGRQLADGLGWPCLDKDDFLEALYEDQPPQDMVARRQLSQRSDVLFRQETRRYEQVVLISHWAPRGGDGSTGTPTEWISDSFDQVIELHCLCPPDVAAHRFFTRHRHPGHLDHLRDAAQLRGWMHNLAAGYPLGLGRVVEAQTDASQDIATLVTRITALLADL